jgi:hypothetical protein
MAKAYFKALVRPGNSFNLNISGWQIEDPNDVEAETTVALTVTSDDGARRARHQTNKNSDSFVKKR